MKLNCYFFVCLQGLEKTRGLTTRLQQHEPDTSENIKK